MKESGINYFYQNIDLPTGIFDIFYTFENGAGTAVSSVSGGKEIFSGILNNVGDFWSKPGSGFFTGNYVTISNADQLNSTSWTEIFVYEKTSVDDCILLSSLNSSSGFKVGINKSNKPYFESFNEQPIIGTSSNNFSSKNVLMVGYQTNYLTLGYYNFNSQQIEAEYFDYAFETIPSNNWRLGPSFTGYLDYFIHLSEYQSPEVVSQLLSGLYNIKTGEWYETTQICSTGITGYVTQFSGITGITGYSLSPDGDEGRDYFTGAFPLSHTQTMLTGYLSSGLYSLGLTGVSCITITGNSIDLFEVLDGYCSGFGMEKIQSFEYIENPDLVKISTDSTLFNNIYNKSTNFAYSGFEMDSFYHSGQTNVFYNGIEQNTNDYFINSGFIYITGGDISDIVFFDLKSGNKISYFATGQSGFGISSYSGQELFLNGVNLTSGIDFIENSNNIYLLDYLTGITGLLTQVPIVLRAQTGIFSFFTGVSFQKDTSNVYINGVRQRNKSMYVEGAIFDKLSGNYYNNRDGISIYDNNNLYWES